MAKIYKNKIVKEKKSVFIKMVCDICGKESESPYSWKKDDFEVEETKIKVEIEQREGFSYPDGGSGTEIEVDICPDCFKNKLIPWLRSQGAIIEEHEWDW